jgi:hypothetical protein
LPLRASLGAGLRGAAAAAKAGAASLGLGVVVFSESPAAPLGFLAVVLLVLGGATWRAPGRTSVLVPILISLSVVVLARLAAGPAPAALAALLVALGALLHVRLWEGVVGLATFGAAVALLGGASAGLVLAFWLVGLAMIALRLLATHAWSRVLSGLRRRSRASPS